MLSLSQELSLLSVFTGTGCSQWALQQKQNLLAGLCLLSRRQHSAEHSISREATGAKPQAVSQQNTENRQRLQTQKREKSKSIGKIQLMKG